MKTIFSTLSAIILLFIYAAIPDASAKSNITTLSDDDTDQKTLVVDCETDLQNFLAESHGDITSLVLSGAAPGKWKELSDVIAGMKSLTVITFRNNGFSLLPPDLHIPAQIKKLSFSENDDLDYNELIPQLSNLANLKKLQLEIYTIFDLPATIPLTHLDELVLINTDEFISSSTSSAPEPMSYDFTQTTAGHETHIKYIAMAGLLDNDEKAQLAERFPSFTTAAMATTAAWVPKYENVKPPIRGLDVPRVNYDVVTGMENVFSCLSGTKIHVPANAFVKMDGSPVNGPVTLSYREFRDPVDILVSGIPMKYDSAGTSGTFESAGMFELSASLGNEPLKLAPGKKIDMNFSTTSKDSSYNFYSYNDKAANWDYLGKPKPVVAATKIGFTVLSRAWEVYNDMINRTRLIDTTLMATRFESPSYIYTNNLDSNYRSQRIYSKKKPYRIVNLVRVRSIRRTKEGDVFFRIQTINGANPEMCSLSNISYRLNEPVGYADFKKSFGRTTFNDLRVSRNGDELEIRLKGIGKILTVHANAVIYDGKKFRDVKNIAARIKAYERRLQGRTRKFDKLAKKGLIRYTQGAGRPDIKMAYAAARKVMSEKEKTMTMAEWLKYVKQATSYFEKINTAVSTLYSSFSLAGMGIYNCDQIRRIESPAEILAEYKSGDSLLYPQTSFVINRKKNQVFSFTRGNIIVSRAAAADNIIVEVTPDNTVGFVDANQLKGRSFLNNGNYSFSVKPLNIDASDVGALKKALGFL